MKNNVSKLHRDAVFYILIIIEIYTIVSGILTNRVFNWHIYGGIGAVFFCVLLYLFYYEVFRYFFVAILLVGTLNVIQFTFDVTTIILYLKVFKVVNINTIELQILSLLLLLLHGILNGKWLLRQFKQLIFKTEAERLEEMEGQIAIFKKQFSEKPKEDLKEMLNNKDRYSKEAIIAIERLLEE